MPGRQHVLHQGLFYQAAYQMVIPWCLPVHGVAPPDAGLCISLDELHKVPAGIFLQSVEVLMDSGMTLWCICHSSQFYCSCIGVNGVSQKDSGEGKK